MLNLLLCQVNLASIFRT